jgi:hypothetical protein
MVGASRRRGRIDEVGVVFDVRTVHLPLRYKIR